MARARLVRALCDGGADEFDGVEFGVEIRFAIGGGDFQGEC